MWHEWAGEQMCGWVGAYVGWVIFKTAKFQYSDHDTYDNVQFVEFWICSNHRNTIRVWWLAHGQEVTCTLLNCHPRSWGSSSTHGSEYLLFLLSSPFSLLLTIASLYHGKNYFLLPIWSPEWSHDISKATQMFASWDLNLEQKNTNHFLELP